MTDEPTDGPGPATGASTLIELLDAAANAGFSTQLIARDGGRVHCRNCDTASDAGDFDVDRHDRLEGASDASDELLVVRAACPNCDAKGVLTLGYGPNASDADVSVIDRLPVDAGGDD